MIFKVDGSYQGERIDKYLALINESLTRSYIQKLIKEGNLSVNSKPVKASYKVMEDDSVELNLPDPIELDVVPSDIPLNIVYEDDDFMIVNKQRGLVVHPAPGHLSDTLVNGLLFHCKEHLSGINGILRPGIVHRIDRDTSGLLVICKNDFSHNNIAAQLKEHSINRIYHGICVGHLKEQEGTVDAPIGRSAKDRKKMAIDPVNGRNAVTHYRVLSSFKYYDLVEFKLETGRTHQIRVHMSSLNHPLLGDHIYGAPPKNIFGIEGQVLHAKLIGFDHPSKNINVEFDSDYPEYFENILNRLKTN